MTSKNTAIHENGVSPKLSCQYEQTGLKLAQEFQSEYKQQIVWRKVFQFILLHIGGLYGFYLTLFVCSWKTILWMMLYGFASAQGITAGAHRLWAHRSYKAKLPLRILLMIWQTISLQTYIYEWVRDHRVHHKFTDTNADPHNSKRGLFYSHIGWLMVKRHRDVKIKGNTVDVSDVEADPVVRFQRKYYLILVIIFCLCIPTIVPWYLWDEDIWVSWFVATMFRLTFSLNVTFAVNSFAHKWGAKPYDRKIGPVENGFISFLTGGEGWHNYHHVFPWDYKAAELSAYRLNCTTMLIDFFASIGWAYDLKIVPSEMVAKRVQRTGDGSRKFKIKQSTLDKSCHNHQESNVWGWGDIDMKYEDVKSVKHYNRLKEANQ
ncbi:hypothetical protein RI129_001568 [Pyrocoelia pectoralis]|uniref:Fatty acid desaturase domain-containing protein n=1 Tax=Pyrocoelia pectoralis TaxID=417401 RepID=A0AAN7VYQ0_9COLE